MLDELNKKENPFRVPEDYFREFNAHIMTMLPDKKKAEAIEDMSKELPFTVPHNYFEEFNATIMDMIPTKKTELSKKVVPLWKKVTPWIAVAAVFSGVIFTTGFLSNKSGSQAATDQITEEKMVANSLSEDEDFFLYLQDEAAESALYGDATSYE